MRKTTMFGAAVLALATSGWIATAAAQAPAPADQSAPAAAPAPDAAPAATPDASSDAKPAKKPMHHHAMKSGKMKMSKKAEAGDSAVDDLNAKSLDAAKSGKSFANATPTPEKPAMSDKKMKMKAKHHAMKKAIKKGEATPAPADASPAPAPDAPK